MMETDKKTINVSRNLVHSSMIGLILSISLVIIIHFFGSWNFSMGIRNESNYNIYERVHSYSYTCPLGGDHYFDGNGKTTINDIRYNKGSSARISGAFISTFDGHWLTIIVFALIFTGLVHFFKKYKLTVT